MLYDDLIALTAYCVFFSEGPCCCRPTPGSSWDCSMQLDILDTCSVPGKNHLPSRRMWIKKHGTTHVKLWLWLGLIICRDWDELWLIGAWNPAALSSNYSLVINILLLELLSMSCDGEDVWTLGRTQPMDIPSVGHDSHGIVSIHGGRNPSVLLWIPRVFVWKGIAFHLWIIIFIHFSHVAS